MDHLATSLESPAGSATGARSSSSSPRDIVVSELPPASSLTQQERQQFASSSGGVGHHHVGHRHPLMANHHNQQQQDQQQQPAPSSAFSPSVPSNASAWNPTSRVSSGSGTGGGGAAAAAGAGILSVNATAGWGAQAHAQSGKGQAIQYGIGAFGANARAAMSNHSSSQSLKAGLDERANGKGRSSEEEGGGGLLHGVEVVERNHPTGVALLRLLANGQPHWYVGQEALPTGGRQSTLFIPGSNRRERLGVNCETMSLMLLTGQSRLVEALAGMYMKSTFFQADEGQGEVRLPCAPQAFLPVERALFAAGMRDGDVVTLVDGRPATQETLTTLGERAHSPRVSDLLISV
eukprot:jgi/Undpi1/7147/HiC_scaffold_22.g09621.m1